MRRYLIIFLALVGLGIILLLLLLPSHPKKAPKVITLPQYANSQAYVEIVVDGPIVAPQNHNTATIEVSQAQANFNLVQGYDGNIIVSKAFNNTENSFNNLLYALYYAGFQHGGVNKQFPSDIGLCATGDRYDLYLINGNKTLEHYWLTSCSNDPSTYSGDFPKTISLFEAQIPNIQQLADGANL